MTIQLADLAASAAANGVVDLIDGGTGAGSIELWSGAMPGDTTTAPGGDLLCSIDYDDPAFGSASAGVATANGTPLSGTGTAAAGTGTEIGFYRINDGDGTTIWQNDTVATSGSTGLVLNTTSVSEGVDVEITAHTYTQPTT